MEEAYQNIFKQATLVSNIFAVIRIIQKIFIDFLLSARISAAVFNSKNACGEPLVNYLSNLCCRREISAATPALKTAYVNRYSNHLSNFNGRRRFAVNVEKQGK